MNLSAYRKKAITILFAFNLGLFVVSLLYTILAEHLFSVDAYKCLFKEFFHIYCPGCGGTRSLAAMLEFDFYTAFQCYPPMALISFFYVDLNLRAVMSVIKDDEKEFSGFNMNWLILIPVVIILNFIIRNILLLGFGFDYLGDLT